MVSYIDGLGGTDLESSFGCITKQAFVLKLIADPSMFLFRGL